MVKLSQNFLTDAKTVDFIIEKAALSPEDTVLEIGPGHGIITNEIRKFSKVVAVEKDRELAREVEDLFPKIKVISGDILKVKLPRFNKIISNVPFEISSPLLGKMVDWEWEEAILIFQKEFGERFFLKPGEKKYSRLSVFISYYYEVKRLGEIPRAKFSPRPKVDGIIVRVRKKKIPFPTDKKFWDLVNSLFRHKRKIVRGALKVEKFSDEQLKSLNDLGQLRVNNLTLNNIKGIYDALS
jgi:16S rRNA (adenine1518-N6/adenine1519-N6)-dimethyltransferase